MNMGQPPEKIRKRRVWTGKDTRIPGVLLFGHYHFLEAEAALVEHQHRNALEICFLLRGEQTYRVGSNLYRLQGGDQFVTFPNEWHDTAGEPQKGELYWIILERDSLLLRPPLDRAIFRRLNRLPVRRFRGSLQAATWLTQIESVLSQRRIGQFDLLRAAGALHQYLLEVIQSAWEATERTPGRRIRDALDWMESHLDEPVRLGEMAAAIGWSEAHFKAVFRREMGQGPHEYFLKRKIARARHLLTKERRTITETAMTLGFSSSQHFSTAFRRFTDQTPSDFKSGQPIKAKDFLTKTESEFTKVRPAHGT